MIIKEIDQKTEHVKELERLAEIAPVAMKSKVKEELRKVQAGMKGEKEAAYFIDFSLKDSDNTAVIHDLRIEVKGRLAQIDHLLIHRTMVLYVLETKHFHAGIRIGEDGQFLKWNGFRKSFEGMPSPLAQNERHVAVLKDLVDHIDWPTRMGRRLLPTYEPFVLVSSHSRIDRPKKFDTSRVIKADALMATIDSHLKDRGVIGSIGALAKVISPETLRDIGQTIASFHRPIVPDYAAKFGLTDQIDCNQPLMTPLKNTSSENPVCQKCNSDQIAIQYGRYGYFIKCSACRSTTTIKLDCGRQGHKERLRKDGTSFYRECAECGTSSLYFVNP